MTTRHRSHSIAPLASLLALGLAFTPSAEAALMTVDTFVDDNTLGSNGNCSLREAVLAANTNLAVDACPAGDISPTVDQIQLSAGLYTLSSVPGPGLTDPEFGDLNVFEDVTITGAGADQTTIDASALSAAVGDNERALTVEGIALVTIDGATIQGGRALLSAGGALGVGQDGELRLIDSTLRDNWALVGGAVYVSGGTLRIEGSTMEDNLAAYRGGALFLEDGATGTVQNSTLSGNVVEDSTGSGGAILHGGDGALPGDLTLLHVTITDNVAGQGSAVASFVLPGGGSMTFRNSLIDGDCFHDVEGFTQPPISLGANVESPGDTCALVAASDQVNVADPMIGPLQLNAGGTTRTHALLAGSAAIDTVFGRCLPTDQNGTGRPEGPACDTGAFEYESPGGCQVAAVGAGESRDLAMALIPCAVLGGMLRRRRRQK